MSTGRAQTLWVVRTDGDGFVAQRIIVGGVFALVCDGPADILRAPALGLLRAFLPPGFTRDLRFPVSREVVEAWAA